MSKSAAKSQIQLKLELENSKRLRALEKRKLKLAKEARDLKKRKVDLEKEELDLKRREWKFEEKELPVESTEDKIGGTRKEDDAIFASEKQSRKKATNVPGSKQDDKAREETAVDPDSALVKIQALAVKFQTDWLPKCVQFITSPPTDAKVRGTECQKLCLSLEEHVIHKADEIAVQRDAVARALRKRLVVSLNAIIEDMEQIADI
jgi:hypothetical protein